MASSHLISANEEQPISRTYQYRKVMKPMLERKRRARINRCLDELKELLVGALQSEGESVSRLEKADVLELTVRHLHKLRRSHQLSESSAGERFRSGFAHCAQEVGKFLSQVPPQTCEPQVSQRLVAHLDNCVRSIEPTPVNCPMTIQMSPTSSTLSQMPSTRGLNVLTQFTPPSSPISSPTYLQHHKLFALENISNSRPQYYSNGPAQKEPFDLSNNENMWRPW